MLGDGHELPFRDLSFDVITIITTLEFVTSPSRVLEEAVRVARRGVLIGALNRTSRLGRKLRSATDEPWVNANLLTDPGPIDPLSGNAVLNAIPVEVRASG